MMMPTINSIDNKTSKSGLRLFIKIPFYYILTILKPWVQSIIYKLLFYLSMDSSLGHYAVSFLMTQDELKKSVATAALDYIEENTIIGVGAGSTIQFFIEALAQIKDKIQGAVASSVATEKLLKQKNIPIFELNQVDELPLYVDSADAFTHHRQLVKGGGGAQTREKILASASKVFICIVDENKMVDILGAFPVAVEVLPMARSFVAREIVKLGGHPEYRSNFTTDNGNIILDVHHWEILEPLKLEYNLNNIPGVVGHGLFAERSADMVLIAGQQGMKVLGASHFLLKTRL